MATQAQLVAYVLWRLRARASGQTPMTEDSADVVAVIPDVLADLALRKGVYIPDADHTPDGAMQWLGMLVENAVAKGFGEPEDGKGMLYAEAMLLNQLARAANPTLKTKAY
jgi:hypothetical protein